MVLRGYDPERQLDALFINSPLRDYDAVARTHGYTLPVLGLAYIATYAKCRGFNVAVLDAEAEGLGPSRVARVVQSAAPRWVGLNLLAPTYEMSVGILSRLGSRTPVMLGGHHAKAMPDRVLRDHRIPRIDALVLGEGETRVAELLGDVAHRRRLPDVLWRERGDFKRGECLTGNRAQWLAPDVDRLPVVERAFLEGDPFLAEDGRREANIVGSRGCPFNCSFCGAARDANPDVKVRARSAAGIVEEMTSLEAAHGVTAFRFVDDLFLASLPFVSACIERFIAAGLGERMVWDATGRTNVLARCPDVVLDGLAAAGCREVALGIESGSPRMLRAIDKQTTPDDARRSVERLTSRGINVKGYFILGFPDETESEMQATIDLVRELRRRADDSGRGLFRASVFQFRPYPGTPEWARLLARGRFSEEELLDYQSQDADVGALVDRNEFDFAIPAQISCVPASHVHELVGEIMREEYLRRISRPSGLRRRGAEVHRDSDAA